ncbi:hypothetical protein NCM_02683 [Burkholderia pseudomallei]
MSGEVTNAAAPAATGRKVTEVAVGVLVRPDGRYLLAQRLIGKPYEGYWEFPGASSRRARASRRRSPANCTRNWVSP